MDELTLGLIGAGAVVVGGVVVYNAWQGAKVRRRMPRPMPADTAEAFARDDQEEQSPFIEPARPTQRREPASSDDAGDTGSRVEPTLRHGRAGRHARRYPGRNDHAERLSRAGRRGRSQAASTNRSNRSCPPRRRFLRRRLRLWIAGLIASCRFASLARWRATRSIPLAQRLRRAGSKPVHIEGKPEGGGAWELLQNGVRYEELRAAAQLANRSGPLNELEFSEFVTGVQQFADAIDAAPEFPDMMETVAMARELDGFAAQCDAQLSINVLSDGAPWSANYVQAVASQDGLLLSRDGTRFVKLDARQSPVFMLQFGDTNFLRDDLTYKGGQMITLVLDVPVADEDILPFRLMCDYAKSLSERIGGRVVDDGRRPLPETALLAIEKQLMTLYAKLEQAGIPAGSPATRRLFSQ